MKFFMLPALGFSLPVIIVDFVTHCYSAVFFFIYILILTIG